MSFHISIRERVLFCDVAMFYLHHFIRTFMHEFMSTTTELVDWLKYFQFICILFNQKEVDETNKDNADSASLGFFGKKILKGL